MVVNEYQLLKKLISISSPSGEEKEIGEYIFAVLRKNGFKVEKYPVSKDRFNIVAKLGEPKIYLSAHIDTVKPYIKYSENKDYIFGRGSCDTKASVASMITAAIKAKMEKINNFGLIFTVGEESVLDGAKQIVKSELDMPFVIVGEPTSLEIVNGHYGILVVEISTKGKAAHSSRPEKGVNAIDVLIEEVAKIKKMKVFSKTLMSLVMIKGGLADNIIPDKAKATFSFRISPKDKNDYVKKIKSLVSSNVKVKVSQEIGAVYCKVPNKLSFIKKVTTVKYLTELSFYKKGVVLGPGDIKYAHSPDEKLPKKELKKAIETYFTIINKFCS